jgi:protein-disulfide isomerase
MNTNIIKYLTIFNTAAIVLIVGFIGYMNFNTKPPAKPAPQQVVKNINMTPLIDGATSMGSKDPRVNVVVFNSFTCGFCRKSKEVVEKIVKKYPDKVRLVYRHFERNEMDVKAGNAAECAGEQGKFWEMYDQIFDDTTGSFNFQSYAKNIKLNINEFNQCSTSNRYMTRISGDSQLGKDLGVSGTPTFVVNGEMVVGFRPFDTFEEIVKKFF